MGEYDVAIIGAGPAGLFCAARTSRQGLRTLLFEKNPAAGRKLLLSGTGQCNLTHAGRMQDLLMHYGGAGKWVKPALFAFTNTDLQAFFQERGLPLVTEENGKVFPLSRKSADVLTVLLDECQHAGAVIRYGEPVREISRDGCGYILNTEQGAFRARAVVITTGGRSYPQTGSTGDGYRLAAALGQPVTEIAPALTPLIIRDYPFASLSGISFEKMRFSLWRTGKKIGSYTGDILFTHKGLSGPGILDASRYIRPGDEIRLSFAGQLSREEFAADLARRTEENRGWQISTILAKYPLPERLNRKLLQLAGIPEDLKCAHFSAVQRSALIRNCTEFPLTVTAVGDYPVAMATRGGIALDSVNPKTMESRVVPGLFFAGEVLDIDGDTGGYNLQAAFSTGYLAAEGIRTLLNTCGTTKS